MQTLFKLADRRRSPARRGPFKFTLRLGWSTALLLALSLQSGCRAEQAWPLWEKYAQRFVDSQGRVIDRTDQDKTTSEGEAYAMFFALVANDRPRFDGLVNWTEANLAAGDLTLHLPAWSWGKHPDGSWQVLDPNPATDADLWMAYTLLEAGRLWREPRFETLGGVMAARIAHDEAVVVPGLGTTLQPGPTGFHPDAQTWVLNPSYLPPEILVRFARAMPDGPWSEVSESLTELLRRGSGAGFAMDWVAAGSTGVHPSVTPAQLAIQTAGQPQASPPVGSYDAIRVYLWLGIADPETPGLRDMLNALPGMAAYLKTNLTPPLVVDGTGKVANADGPAGFSAAVAPYLAALGRKQAATAQMNRLTATQDPGSGLYGRNATYYDQNLALFATGWAEHLYRFDRDGRLKVKWTSK